MRNLHCHGIQIPESQTDSENELIPNLFPGVHIGFVGFGYFTLFV